MRLREVAAGGTSGFILDIPMNFRWEMDVDHSFIHSIFFFFFFVVVVVVILRMKMDFLDYIYTTIPSLFLSSYLTGHLSSVRVEIGTFAILGVLTSVVKYTPSSPSVLMSIIMSS